MNSRIRKRAGQVTLNNPKEQSGLKTKGGVLTSCFQVPGQVQLEGKKLTNRDFTTVLVLLRGEGFQDDDFRYLNISENFLDHLPTNLPLGIQALHLGGNRFTSLIGFEHLQELERLDVSRNVLQRSWGLLQNANLRHLNLAGNRIRVVEGLETLKLLEALDLSDNLIRTHDDMRALSFNDKLLSLRLEGNPVSRKKSIRVVVLHLLPSLRMLDGHRFLPFSRDPLSPTAQGPLSLHECSYMDIHQSRQVQGRSQGDMLEGPPPPASHPEAHAAAEEDASMDPPPRRYIPSWRCPPNPLPRGWKDYRQLAKESVGLAQPDRRSPSPDRRPPRRASPPRPRLSTQAQVLEDYGYSRCPEPNTFSYNYIVLPRPTLLEGGSIPSTLSPQREPAREGRGRGMQGPTARPTAREELLQAYQQWVEEEEGGGENEGEEQQRQQQRRQQRQQQQQRPPPQPQPQHKLLEKQQEQQRQRQRQEKEQQRGRGHEASSQLLEARDTFPAAPQHVSPPVPPPRERDMGRRRQSQESHQPSYMPPPQLSHMTPPRASPVGRPASALSSLSVDERGRPPVSYGGGVLDASPGRSSDDSSSYGLDDGSHEMREIVKMLRDLLLQKRETIEMLMKSSEGGSLASPSDSGSAREGSSRHSSSA